MIRGPANRLSAAISQAMMISTGRVVALLLSILLLNACAQFEPDDGIGGTGIIAGTDGIGGTGHRGDPDADGIGGTGLWANLAGSGDVAIYGVVTSLDTLVVNGHGMYLSENSEYLLNGLPEKIATMNVGQVIAVRAGLVDEVITAKAVHSDDAVIGPVDSVATDGAWLEVLGQRVVLGSYTQVNLGPGRDSPAAIHAGDVVRISGLRRLDGSIDASLILMAGSDTSYSVAGWAMRTADNSFVVGSLRLPTVATAGLEDPAHRVVVTGTVRDGEFAVDQVAIRQALPFADEVTRWSIQGYAAIDPNFDQIRFSSYQGNLSGGRELGPKFTAEQRVIMGIRAGVASMLEIDGVRPSPFGRPDSSMTIPTYSPGIRLPEVVFGPNILLPQSVPGTDITIPKGPIGIDPSGNGISKVPRMPNDRPNVPRPVPPRVDMEPPGMPNDRPNVPRPVPPRVDMEPPAPVLQPTTDSLPTGSIGAGPNVKPSEMA